MGRRSAESNLRPGGALPTRPCPAERPGCPAHDGQPRRRRMSPGPQVSLVFPAYNPGPSLAETLRQIGPFLDAQAGRWEAVFVCDGCTDGTAERLDVWRKVVRAPVQVIA